MGSSLVVIAWQLSDGKAVKLPTWVWVGIWIDVSVAAFSLSVKALHYLVT